MIATIDDINLMPEQEFVAVFGDVAEDSPWVAEAAARRRPFKDRADLIGAFTKVITEADADRKLALLYAHPDLAGRAAVAGHIGAASKAEQASAGLDRLSEKEFIQLAEMNAAYRRRFGFPFIRAVRNANRHDIMASLDARMNADPEQEFATAVEQVCWIVRFRLEDLVQE